VHEKAIDQPNSNITEYRQSVQQEKVWKVRHFEQ